MTERLSKESATINALRAKLERHGYQLYGISHFSDHDRIRFGNKYIKISLTLRGKISEIAFETLVTACLGSEGAGEK